MNSQPLVSFNHNNQKCIFFMNNCWINLKSIQECSRSLSVWDNGYRNLDFQVLRVTERHQENNALAELLKTKMRARTKGRRLLRSERAWAVWTRLVVGGRCSARGGSESKGTTAAHWTSREGTWAKLNPPTHKPRESDAWVEGTAVGMLRPVKSGSGGCDAGDATREQLSLLVERVELVQRERWG